MPARWLVHCLLMLPCGALCAQETSGLPAYHDHRRLTYFLDDAGHERPVQTAEAWAIRRGHILQGFQAALGELPTREQLPPLDPVYGEPVAADGHVRVHVTIVAGEGERIPCWLLLPPQLPDQKLPAMLALHQTTNIGKDEPAGLGGLPNLAYGRELAQRGYVVLAPDYPSFGEYEFDYAASPYPSGSLKGVLNHMRCVDFLAGHKNVDPQRIGVIGHSLGGHNSIFVGVFDERLQVVVSSCGWTPFHDYYAGDIRGWTSDRYIPRLRDVYELDPDRLPFDFYELVAALAPRAFFSSSPERDSNFEVAGVRKAAAEATPIFELLSAAERLKVVYPECEHDFPPEVRREAYAFVDRVLSHQPIAETP